MFVVSIVIKFLYFRLRTLTLNLKGQESLKNWPLYDFNELLDVCILWIKNLKEYTIFAFNLFIHFMLHMLPNTVCVIQC